MTINLAHFDALTQRGLKVIPLWENSKAPIGKRWNENWDRDLVRAKFERFPEANLGLLLGEIVDVEGDSEDANRIIIDLIGDYPHPSYTSTKSIHHLFTTPDKNLRHLRFGEIEFRGHGHQSVIPPSKHQGTAYKWMKSFRFPVPPMPSRLYDFYCSKAKNHVNLLKPHHVRVWCDKCNKECFLHKKRFELELKAFKLLGAKWECHKCRSFDLRPACRLLRSGAPDSIVILNALSGLI